MELTFQFITFVDDTKVIKDVVRDVVNGLKDDLDAMIDKDWKLAGSQ